MTDTFKYIPSISLCMKRICKHHGETEFYWKKNKRKSSGGQWVCLACKRTAARAYYHKKDLYHTKNILERLHQSGRCRPLEEAKDCPLYLGDIAERALLKHFPTATRMPRNNRGYDYINNQDKIDVKSSILHVDNRWSFNLRITINGKWIENTIADHFFIIAFDNRTSLTPVHIWLVPGPIVNHLKGLNITNTAKALKKWSKYELPLLA